MKETVVTKAIIHAEKQANITPDNEDRYDEGYKAAMNAMKFYLISRLLLEREQMQEMAQHGYDKLEYGFSTQDLFDKNFTQYTPSNQKKMEGKQQYSNEFLAQMLATYGKLHAANKFIGTGDYDIIHLTPLSEITDEHAIEVAMMLTQWPESMERLKDISVRKRQDGDHNLDVFIMEFSGTNKWQINYRGGDFYGWRNGNGMTACVLNNQRQVFDYLRSRGYDCGYGEIPSLIEAGIAIKKQ